MTNCIDIHAMLLRAEAKAKKALDDYTATVAKIKANYVDEHRFDFAGQRHEEAYATACAVRRNWEDCERRASKENQSASSYKYATGDRGCMCAPGQHDDSRCPYRS